MEKFIIKRKVVIEEEVTYLKYVAIKIAELRKKKGLTQSAFAKKLGLSRASVVNIENGNQQVSIKNLYSMCKCLGVKSGEILPF